MLLELLVENYAVVERVRVRFHPGLNLLTGETGSGKSLVVDALGLLLGGRASAEMVRSDTDRARISGIFELPKGDACRRLLDEAGVEIEDGEILIEREVLAGGKSRCFLGSRPVTAALLRELAPFLGDIHGQHEQQAAFLGRERSVNCWTNSPAPANCAERVAGFFHQWEQLRRELEDLDRSEQEKLRLADLWSFQRKEIDSAGLKPGEDVQLENERGVLKNVAKLQENANAATPLFTTRPRAHRRKYESRLKKLEDLSRIDGSLLPILRR